MISATRAVAAGRSQAATRLLVTSRRQNTTYNIASRILLQQNSCHQHRHFSALSSLNEPTLFTTHDDQSTNDDGVSATSLRSDVRTMGTLLGDAIALHHGEEILEKVEVLKTLFMERAIPKSPLVSVSIRG